MKIVGARVKGLCKYTQILLYFTIPVTYCSSQYVTYVVSHYRVHSGTIFSWLLSSLSLSLLRARGAICRARIKSHRETNDRMHRWNAR